MVNIFFLHSNPSIAVSYYCDIHVSKILLEIAQILYTALQNNMKCNYSFISSYAPLMKSKTTQKGYSPIKSKTHPMVLWASNSIENFEYACQFGIALSKEFQTRFSNIHSSSTHILWLTKVIKSSFVRKYFVNIDLTIPPKCFGEESDLMKLETKTMDELIYAHRLYYVRKLETNSRLKYNRTEKPCEIETWNPTY